MATGQTILTLASIVLLAIISMSIRQMYIQSVHNTVDSQVTSDALNFGRDLIEEVHSFAFRYDQLDTHFGQFNNVEDPSHRRGTEDDTADYQVVKPLFATIEVGAEEVLEHGQNGRIVTIRIFEEDRDDEFVQIAEYVTSVLNLQQD